jgi:hypothetical protein
LIHFTLFYSPFFFFVQKKIPETLGFKEEKAITDYHILLMRKETIAIRICEEMVWLFKNSI